MPTAVIIGATGGIGTAVTRGLVGADYAVLLAGTQRTKLQALRAGARQAAQPPQHQVVDVTKSRDIGWLALQCRRRFPTGLDLLVFCHGAAPQIGLTSSLALSQFAAVWDVDVWGTVATVKALLPSFAPRGGSVVMVGSYHCFGTYPGRAPYAAAKSALLGLTRAWAIEWGPRKIRCNLIAPGQVDGERTRTLIQGDAYTQMLRRSPTGQMTQPEDIAQTVLWLANCPSVNGQAIVLDHGWSASYWWGDYST